MEKRIFLAFLLSFAFLTFWTKMVSPPAPTKKASFSNEVSKSQAPSKSIKEIHQEFPSEAKVGSPVSDDKKQDFIEQVKIIENSKLRVEFTNIGGTIKKITIKQYQATLPVKNILNVEGFSSEEFILEEITENKIVYIRKELEGFIKKSYVLSNQEYFIEASIEIPKKESFNMYTLDISRLDKIDDRDKSLFEYSIASSDKIFRKSNAFKFEKKEVKSDTVNTDWFGFRDRYFAFLIKAEYDSQSYNLNYINENQMTFSDVPRETTTDNIYNFKIYFGPQINELLRKGNCGFERIILYSNWGIIDFVAKAVYSILIHTHKIIKSWGTSIILIGIFIYLITYPLTMAGMSSMRKMQSLQPQMTKLREQYKNNPQKLNQEMMDLYKKHKVNPLGGCLPMILQMPIFIGIYQILWRSVALKGERFLWIKDLSEPDRLFVFKQSLPLIGNEFNILPILMGIVMFFQQNFSMKTMVVSDPAQQSQQKMMLWMLPIMMLFIFYKAASGLTLYFIILYILTTFTQWKIAKSVKAE